jgi:hypothetical protein
MSARRSATETKSKPTAKRNRRVANSRTASSSPPSRGRRNHTKVEVAPPTPSTPNNELTIRDDPRLDRRIIEGMLHDRKTLLDDLAKEGIKAAAVMRRAADLGLSEAYIRQVQGVAADLAGERPGGRRTPNTLGARTCLSCDRVFLSSGPGNRLCMRCRGGDAGLAQL